MGRFIVDGVRLPLVRDASCGTFMPTVMSLLELSPTHVTPGVLAQSCHPWSSCPVLTLLELLPSHVTSSTLALVISLLELLPSLVTSFALAQACHSWSTCPVISHLEHLPSHVTPVARAQSCHSWSSCLVLSLLELVVSHDIPGVSLVVAAEGFNCRRGNKGTDKNQQVRKIHSAQLRCG